MAIAAGYTSALALRSDGTLVPWGQWPDAYRRYGAMTVPPGLSNLVSIAVGYAHALALRDDGTVLAWGLNTSAQTNVPSGLRSVTGIAAGYAHSLALFGPGGPVTKARARTPKRSGGGFSLEIPTQNGRVCILEHKRNLADPGWAASPLSVGEGTMQTLSDPNATNDARFYSVRAW